MSYIAWTTMRGARNFLVVFVIILVSPSFETSLAHAQGTTAITPTTGIGNLGTRVTTDGQTVQITGGTRPGNGANLFHSFDQFIVGPGDAAHFLNTTPSLRTENILSRVTGGNPSSIFGTIDTMSYPEANLFLMNPAGIVFGPSATLNVGGSVAFTTANYLRLAGADGSGSGIFHADTTATSLLTSASVSTFGFLSPNPASIAVQGSRLIVPPGQSISLVGGNKGFTYTNPGTGAPASVPDGVTVTGGHLIAPGGLIHIVSVASAGEIVAATPNQASKINDPSFGSLGTVRVTQNSKINTSGEGGGRIHIRGGRLLVDNSTISANSTKTAKSGTGPRLDPGWLGIGIEVAQEATIDNGAIVETNVEQGAYLGSGGVRITADRITISGGPKILKFVETHPTAELPFAGIRSNVTSKSTAASSGGISLTATSIDIKSLGQIETTTTTSAGHAGHISLQASGDIVLDSGFIRSASATSSGNAGNIVLSSNKGDIRLTPGLVASQTDGSGGNAGNISFRANQGSVSLTTSSFITSQANNSSGSAGSITIEAPHGDVILDGTTVLNSINKDTGTLGGIQVTANNLFLTASRILENNVAKQAAGNIVIMLEGRLNLTGDSFIQTGTDGPANAAHLIIRARDILITENSSLLTEPTSTSTGAAGAIDLSARSLTIQNGGKISATTFGTSPSATAGSITINVTDQVMMSDNASITASSNGPGNAGAISINAGRQLELTNGSSITTTTESAQANGGNINILAIDRIRLVDSTISTSVKGTEGSGGNIFIDPKVVILEGSNVTANAVTGAGGNITFVTPLFLADAASRISASSERGPSGTVTIQSPTSNLSGAVGQLVSKTSPPQVLLQNRCVASAGGEQSTFILAGHDTLPIEPGGWLRSPISMEHWMGEDTEHASGLMVKRNRPNGLPRMIRPMDKTQVLSLRGLTRPGFLVQSFAGDSPTGCRS
jgi:filamentous hemagglutinin family protein